MWLQAQKTMENLSCFLYKAVHAVSTVCLYVCVCSRCDRQNKVVIYGAVLDEKDCLTKKKRGDTRE